MKKGIIVVVLIMIMTGCTQTSRTSEEDIREHAEHVKDNNIIEEQTYSNDYIGMQIDVPEEYQIQDYKDMNLASMPDNRNILMLASSNQAGTLFITEMLKDGSDYKKETIEDLENGNNEDGEHIEYEELEATIGGKEAYRVNIKEILDDKYTMLIDYYIIEKDDAIISIVITYDEDSDMVIINDLLEGIQFDS